MGLLAEGQLGGIGSRRGKTDIMTTFVLLLRGINLGKANRIPMAELRELLGGLGFQRSATLLNSGNAAFSAVGPSAESHAKRIAHAIQERFGFEIVVTVKTVEEMRRIVAGNPFAQGVVAPSHFLVVFAQDPESLAGLVALKPLLNPGELFALTADAAYLGCLDGLLKSAAATALMGKAGRAATTRNWSTTLKLLDLAERF